MRSVVSKASRPSSIAGKLTLTLALFLALLLALALALALTLTQPSVIDCSGTYGNSNRLGRGGAPAIGERQLRDEARYLEARGRAAAAAATPGPKAR